MKKFKVYYQENGNVNSKVFHANSAEDLDLPKNILKIKELNVFKHKFNSNGLTKVKNDEIIKMFEQLSLMLESNLLMIDSISILKKSIKNRLLSQILNSFENSLKSGKPLYKALENFDKKIDPIILPFFKVFEIVEKF